MTRERRTAMTLENLVNKVIDKVQEELQGSFEVEASGRHVHLSLPFGLETLVLRHQRVGSAPLYRHLYAHHQQYG